MAGEMQAGGETVGSAQPSSQPRVISCRSSKAHQLQACRQDAARATETRVCALFRAPARPDAAAPLQGHLPGQGSGV